MSNKVSSHLFDLIRSLSKSEKRYFKLISSKHIIGQENKYMILFDYIDSMSDYDESMIIKHFKGEAFLNKFSITKARLYDNVLKSLEQFHSNNSIDAQIFSLLNSAEILHKKSLYKQAKKVLRSAEKLALKNQRFALLIEISIRSKKLVETSNYSDIDLNDLQTILKEDDNKISKLTNYLRLWNVKSELFYVINRKNRSRNKKELERLKSNLDQLNSIPKTALFFDSEYLKNHIYSAYSFYEGNFNKSLKCLLNNIQLFQENKNRIKSDPNVYFSILVNTIFIANKIEEKKIYQDTLLELKTFPKQYKITLTEDMEIKMFSSSNSLELSLFINSGEFDKASKLIPEIEEGLNAYGDKINQVRKSFLCFQIAYTYFGNGMYSESLKWINEILNEDSKDIKELLGFTNLFNLILHYELDNSRLLPYALKSVERFYGKKPEDKAFESLFLSYFKKIIKMDREINRKELFYDLHENIKETDENVISVPLEYFRFDYWIEAKAKNIAFSSMFRS
jgi:hypothetical protein